MNLAIRVIILRLPHGIILDAVAHRSYCPRSWCSSRTWPVPGKMWCSCNNMWSCPAQRPPLRVNGNCIYNLQRTDGITWHYPRGYWIRAILTKIFILNNDNTRITFQHDSSICILNLAGKLYCGVISDSVLHMRKIDLLKSSHSFKSQSVPDKSIKTIAQYVLSADFPNILTIAVIWHYLGCYCIWTK